MYQILDGKELARKIREELKVKNIYLEVINARYIKPMDTKILKMLVKQNTIKVFQHQKKMI